MQQLVPGLGERLRQLVRVLVKALRDRRVDRIDRSARSVVNIIGACRFDGSCASGTVPCASGFFGVHWNAPAGLLVSSQSYLNRLSRKLLLHFVGVLDHAPSSPLVMVSLPLPLPKRVLPAEALLIEGRGLGLGPDVLGRGRRAVRFAERVAADDQRRGLLVVHRHAAERFPDVAGGGQRIGLAVRALRVHVDQAHLHGAERPGELAVAAVALVAEPGVLRSPEDLFRLPDVGPPEAEAERLEAHGLQGDVTGEHQQVGPGDLLPVLLLDRPQQAARLVEVGVVGPAVQRREALRPLPPPPRPSAMR